MNTTESASATSVGLEGYEDWIETVFKAVPPVAKLKEGFGAMGVLLRDPKEDKLQCHICGKWFSYLSMHLRKHEILSRDYRIKFNLPLSFPLINIAGSRAISEKSMRHKKRFMTYQNKHKKGQKVTRRKQQIYGRTNLAYLNMIGACPEQINKRYLIVSDIVGKSASDTDILKYDPKLHGILQRRYKNLNNYRRSQGFNLNMEPKKWGREKIIAKLRQWAIEKGHPPVSQYFFTKQEGYPYYQSIRTYFGSWRRAMIAAGFEQ